MTHIDVHGDKPLFVDVLTTGFTPQKYIQWLLATQMVRISTKSLAGLIVALNNTDQRLSALNV